MSPLLSKNVFIVAKTGLSRKPARALKSLPAFEPLELVAIDVQVSLPKIQSSFKHIIVIVDRSTKLVRMVSLRGYHFLDDAQVYLEYLRYKYGPQNTLLTDNGKQFSSQFSTVYVG